MKNIQKMLLSAFVAGLVLVAGGVSVKATEAVAPSYAGGIRFQNPSFLGIKAAVLNKTTTSSQLVTGQGLLYAICPNGGTLGKYTAVYDYLKASANFPADPLNTLLLDGGNADKYMIAPIVPTRTLSAEWGAGGQPYAFEACFVPPWPVRFELGLIGKNDNSGGRAVFYYRLDSDVNP